GRRSASLQVAEDADARFLAGALLDFRGHDGPKAAQPRFAVFLGAAGRHIVLPMLSGAFGHDDESEVLALPLPLGDFRAHAVIAEGNLRDEDHVAAARDAGR